MQQHRTVTITTTHELHRAADRAAHDAGLTRSAWYRSIIARELEIKIRANYSRESDAEFEQVVR